MKLAVVLPSLAKKGPVVVARDIVNNLAPHLDHIDVYYFDDITEVTFDADVHRLDIRDRFDFDRYDVIHSHMLRPDFYLWKNRSRIRAKCVTTLHNYVHDDLKYQYNLLTAAVFSRIWGGLVSRHDMIVTLSAHMQEYYRKRYPNPNLTYIYNGRDIPDVGGGLNESDAARILSFKGDGILLGAVALLTRRKGIEQVVKVLPKDPKLRLIVVGSGREEENLKRLARSLNVEDQCLFVGFTPHPHYFYKYIDVYVMASRSEGFPLALIESASFRMPTVCSDIPVLKEVFDDTEVSFFHLDDIEGLYWSIMKAYDSRGSLAKNIFKKYTCRYTASAMASSYLSLYRELAGVPNEQGAEI